jgi:hypothetical protein
MKALIIIFAFYGATFLIKEADITAWLRRWLIHRGPFFHNMLECWFCTGFWMGMLVYLLDAKVAEFSLCTMLLWGLAGASVSYIGNVVVDRLELR